MTKPHKKLTLLFLRKGDNVLLAMKKRGFGQGKWNGVGGKVESDETIEVAMVRECQEEINVTPTVYEKVADIQFDEYFKDMPTIMDVQVFIATAWEGEPTESEEMKPQWFAINNIPYEDMWTDDPYWLPLIINGKKITANFTLNENNIIIDHSVKLVSNLV